VNDTGERTSGKVSKVSRLSRLSQPRAKRKFGLIGPVALVLVSALFFVLPLLSMARFSFQTVPMIRLGLSTLTEGWSFGGVTRAFGNTDFRTSLWLSTKLALGTVALSLLLLLPTVLWVHLRLPKARSVVEFLTVLPYVIPPIALVAGVLPLKPHARWFLNSNYSLIPFYAIFAMPFTFRSLDAGIRALDVKTLVDASRSLGSTWGTTLRRVIVPNMRAAIISASFLTAAVVLGEYTMARILLKRTLPAFMAQYQGGEPQGGMALALSALVATTTLFALLSALTKKRLPKADRTPASIPPQSIAPQSPAPPPATEA
jgi:putative spermidine/putrescine transport system permease protein